MTDAACATCSRPFDDSCVISINGPSEKVQELQQRLADKKKLVKGKKRKLLETMKASEEESKGTRSQADFKLQPS